MASAACYMSNSTCPFKEAGPHALICKTGGFKCPTPAVNQKDQTITETVEAALLYLDFYIQNYQTKGFKPKIANYWPNKP